MNDVKSRAKCSGGAPDVSRVVRDFGVQKNDVQERPQRSPPQLMRAQFMRA